MTIPMGIYISVGLLNLRPYLVSYKFCWYLTEKVNMETNKVIKIFNDVIPLEQFMKVNNDTFATDFCSGLQWISLSPSDEGIILPPDKSISQIKKVISRSLKTKDLLDIQRFLNNSSYFSNELKLLLRDEISKNVENIKENPTDNCLTEYKKNVINAESTLDKCSYIKQNGLNLYQKELIDICKNLKFELLDRNNRKSPKKLKDIDSMIVTFLNMYLEQRYGINPDFSVSWLVKHIP